MIGVRQTDSPRASAFDWQRIFPFAVFLLAVAVCLINISPIAYGDELGTLIEARDLGVNPQGMPFLFMLNLLSRITDDVRLLHVPTILFGSLIVPIVWFWLRPLRGASTAALVALLLALAPLRVEMATFIRFHTWMLFCSVLFYWVYSYMITRERRLTPTEIVVLLVATALVITAQLFGAVVVALAFVHWMFTYPKRCPIWVKALVILGALSVIALMVIMFVAPSLLEGGFRLFGRLINMFTVPTFGGAAPKGFSLVILAKQPLFFIYFVFGIKVYPLWLIAVLPGVLVAGLLALLGLISTWRERPRFSFNFIVIFAAGGLVITTAVFDPLVPPSYIASVTYSHISWIMPLFIWAVAEGIASIRPARLRPLGAGAFIVFQIIGLVNMANPNWDSPDVPGIINAVNQVDGENPIIFAGERATGILNAYLEHDAPVQGLWNLTETLADVPSLIEQHDRVVVIVSDFKDDQLCRYNRILPAFTGYRLQSVTRSHPYIVYIYDTTSPPQGNAIPLPFSFPHMRFQDLTIPQTTDWNGTPLTVNGISTLPTCEDGRQWLADDLATETPTSRLVLLSNIVFRRVLPAHTAIAQITVTPEEGDPVVFPIRVNVETQGWDSDTCGGCTSAVEWFKRAHFLGFSAYPRANDQFTAHIWGVEMPLNAPTDIASIAVDVAPEFNGQFNIWGLYRLD